MLIVLEKCNLSWRRATADEYEQCTIMGAFRQSIFFDLNSFEDQIKWKSALVNKQNQLSDEKYLMSIVKVNTIDRTLIINNPTSINEFLTRLNLHGKFIHIDSKFFIFFYLIWNLFVNWLFLQSSTISWL